MSRNRKKKFVHFIAPDSDDVEDELEVCINDLIDNSEELQIKKIEIEPASEILTSGSGIHILIQLPGIKTETLNVTIVNACINIHAASINKNYKKIICLPHDCDIEKRKISYKNYALDISVPFKPETLRGAPLLI